VQRDSKINLGLYKVRNKKRRASKPHQIAPEIGEGTDLSSKDILEGEKILLAEAVLSV
jgi:hypothetical protein